MEGEVWKLDIEVERRGTMEFKESVILEGYCKGNVERAYVREVDLSGEGG